MFFYSLNPEYDGNKQLKHKSEKILLNLFTNKSIDLKRQIYRLSLEKIATFFTSILNGKTITQKYRTNQMSMSNFIGLPLNEKILNEIISFGLSCSDSTIQKCAENIITTILKNRKHLFEFKDEINDFLIPSLPLLLCHSSRKSTFGMRTLVDNNLLSMKIILKCLFFQVKQYWNYQSLMLTIT